MSKTEMGKEKDGPESNLRKEIVELRERLEKLEQDHALLSMSVNYPSPQPRPTWEHHFPFAW